MNAIPRILPLEGCYRACAVHGYRAAIDDERCTLFGLPPEAYYWPNLAPNDPIVDQQYARALGVDQGYDCGDRHLKLLKAAGFTTDQALDLMWLYSEHELPIWAAFINTRPHPFPPLEVPEVQAYQAQYGKKIRRESR
jgi:hypothetical protein